MLTGMSLNGVLALLTGAGVGLNVALGSGVLIKTGMHFPVVVVDCFRYFNSVANIQRSDTSGKRGHQLHIFSRHCCLRRLRGGGTCTLTFFSTREASNFTCEVGRI